MWQNNDTASESVLMFCTSCIWLWHELLSAFCSEGFHLEISLPLGCPFWGSGGLPAGALSALKTPQHFLCSCVRQKSDEALPVPFTVLLTSFVFSKWLMLSSALPPNKHISTISLSSFIFSMGDLCHDKSLFVPCSQANWLLMRAVCAGIVLLLNLAAEPLRINSVTWEIAGWLMLKLAARLFAVS